MIMQRVCFFSIPILSPSDLLNSVFRGIFDSVVDQLGVLQHDGVPLQSVSSRFVRSIVVDGYFVGLRDVLV